MLYKRRKADYMGILDLELRTIFVQQTAQGSAAWLTEPFNEFGGTAEDKVFDTMMRIRLLMDSPGTGLPPPRGSSPCCGRRGRFQTLVCGKALDDKGKHDMHDLRDGRIHRVKTQIKGLAGKHNSGTRRATT